MPSARVKTLPEPADQELPLLVLYSQVASASMPETVIEPLLVTPSERLAPLSVSREKLGASGVVVSTVSEIVLVLAVLPAASVTAARNR